MYHCKQEFTIGLQNKSASARSATYKLEHSETALRSSHQKTRNEIKETFPFIGVCRCSPQRP